MATKVINGKEQVGTVLVTFVENGERYFLVGQNARIHSREPLIKYPGGTLETDDVDDMGGALRELSEETGLELEFRHRRRKNKSIRPFTALRPPHITHKSSFDVRANPVQKTPAKTIHVYCADYGTLTHAEAQKLKAQVKPSDDLVYAEFVPQSACDFQNYTIKGKKAYRANMDVMREFISPRARVNQSPRKTAPKQTQVQPLIPTRQVTSQGTPGYFETINLNFNVLSNLNQAHAILVRADALYRQGQRKIGITYSANLDQSKKIHAANRNNSWHPISGSNQADVMREVGNLLQSTYPHLQGVFQILPITTCETPPLRAVSDAVIKQDLQAISDFAANGGVVLGWQNQTSTLGKPFAIGGGVASGVLSGHQSQMIQDHLMALQRRYPQVRSIPVTVTPPAAAQAPQRLFTQQPTTIHKASTQLVASLKQQDSAAVNPQADLIIRKGNLKGTFKLGFASAADAERFCNRIKQTHGFSNVTYYGEGEQYPMNANGDVTLDGTGKYRYIVRFEVAADALTYLQKVNVPECRALYDAIIGVNTPAPAIAHTA